MSVKTETNSSSKRTTVMQGRWGKSLSPPSNQQSAAQRKGKSGFYPGKSILPPQTHPLQKKADTEQKNEVQVPGKVQRKMEGAFGSSFSDVKVYKDSSKAKDLGAQAFTQGNEVHFAQGKFDPNSPKGQELLGHELTHVEQQRQGKVSPTTQAKGVAINNDASLEREADVKGAKAARGEKVQSGGSPAQLKSNGQQPVQASLWGKIKKGAKKIGGKIKKGVKKVGKGIKKVGGKIVKGVKAIASVAKDIKAVYNWVKKAKGVVKLVIDLIKNKKWSEAYKAKDKVDKAAKPPSVVSKFMTGINLVTSAIDFFKSVLKIKKGVDNKNIVKKEVKPARNDKEKAAKDTVTGIQTIRISMGAANATDAVMAFSEAILTLAGAATAGIGAIVAAVIKVVRVIISGGKLVYKLYRKYSADYKAKVKAQNEKAAEGMITLKDAKLYQVIGMKYNESSAGKQQSRIGMKNAMRIRLGAISKPPEDKDKSDQSQNKKVIIDHLNKEREDAAAG